MSHFTAGDVAGKRVLDLGRGTGELSFFVHELGATRVPHKASVMSLARRTLTPARYIFTRASSTELSPLVALDDRRLEGQAAQLRNF